MCVDTHLWLRMAWLGRAWLSRYVVCFAQLYELSQRDELCICSGGVDVSMLSEALEFIGDEADTEASGNVTIDTVKSIAQTGVTFISCGALTHSVVALDISLKIQLLK